MSIKDELKTDIECIVNNLDEQKDKVVGAILITFTNDGEVHLDYSAAKLHLAMAVAHLQAEFSKQYETGN